MHVSKEFLMEAVGLSLLVALILVSMQMFQRAMKTTAILEERQAQQATELEEYEIVKYDDLLIDGMTAISYIKRMTGSYGLPVRVSTGRGNFVVTESTQYAELRNTGSDNYISPLEKYRCKVVRDDNRVITEILIEKEGE